MLEITNTTYDLYVDDPAPKVGQYLVTIGKRGVGQVAKIRSVRAVVHRTIKTYQRYVLTIQKQPELKAYTEYELVGSTANVWVRGVPALPCFWYPRNAK